MAQRIAESIAETIAARLQERVATEFPQLQQIAGTTAAEKITKAWSRKEELGHLIDSASNNHLRFVGAALKPEFQGSSYDPDGSVAIHGYQDADWPTLLEFWRSYNLLLARLISRIPEASLSTPCKLGNSPAVTLQFVIEDYILHMQHHLDHILRREVVTAYPAMPPAA